MLPRAVPKLSIDIVGPVAIADLTLPGYSDRVRLTFATVCAVLLIAPAAHADVTVAAASKTVKPGGRVAVTVAVTGETSCKLTAAGVKSTARAAGKARITFTFRAAGAARPGRYTVAVTCGKRRAAAVVRVTGRRRPASKQRRPFSGPVNVTSVAQPKPQPAAQAPAASAPAAPPPGAPADPNAAADVFMQQRLDAVRASGQCTGWLVVKREDLIRAVDRPRILAALQGAATIPMMLTTSPAKQWGQIAREAGRPVTGTPAPGSILVAQPGALGSGTDGHVAYVEAVATDPVASEITLTITEWNAPTLGVTTTRTMTFAAPLALNGVEFIG